MVETKDKGVLMGKVGRRWLYSKRLKPGEKIAAAAQKQGRSRITAKGRG